MKRLLLIYSIGFTLSSCGGGGLTSVAPGPTRYALDGEWELVAEQRGDNSYVYTCATETVKPAPCGTGWKFLGSTMWVERSTGWELPRSFTYVGDLLTLPGGEEATVEWINPTMYRERNNASVHWYVWQKR